MEKRFGRLITFMAIIIAILMAIYYQFFNYSFYIDVIVMLTIVVFSVIIIELIAKRMLKK